MVFRLVAGLAVLGLAASRAGGQEPSQGRLRELFERCGSGIPWIKDSGLTAGPWPKVGRADREALLRRALDLARAKNRLVLWYAYRIRGRQMYRPGPLDQYAMAAFWSDEDLVSLVRYKFVPLKMYADARIGGRLGVQALSTVEPAIILIAPDGKVVFKIDRIRTFNADWLRSVLLRVLAQQEAFNSPPETKARGIERARLWIASGDYSEATGALEPLFESADPEVRAQAFYLAATLQRRIRDAKGARESLAEAEKLSGDRSLKGRIEVERGLLFLRERRLEKAAEAFETALKEDPKGGRVPEALYLLGAVAWLRRDEEEARRRWTALVRGYPDSPYAWRAAANLVRSKDTTPEGPLVHGFEDLFWGSEEIYTASLTSTTWPRREQDREDIVRRAVGWLLLHQRSSGAWTDTRYAFWQGPEILPNVRVAVTSLAAAALLEWREIAPGRIDAALRAADRFLFNAKNFARGENEEVYAHAYRLMYLGRRLSRAKDPGERGKLLELIQAGVDRLAGLQDRNGRWAHEYPNPFCTAVAVHALHVARESGAEVGAAVFRRAARALEGTRGRNGAFAYDTKPGRRSTTASASARMPLCEMALVLAGAGSLEAVREGLEIYWKHYGRIERVRKCDFHSDEELAGFFFYHGFFHAIAAARLLGKRDRERFLVRFRKAVVRLPEIDGSFIDDHELGKAYGTAMALLSMKDME